MVVGRGDFGVVREEVVVMVRGAWFVSNGESDAKASAQDGRRGIL